MSTPRNQALMNMAMDKPYMENSIYYRAKIKSKLPQLHDSIMPI